jgi:TrmH family RNA methyltransferase
MITSTGNKTVKLARQLKTKKGRDRGGCYLAEGPKLLAEALNHDAELSFAFFCEDAQEALAARCERAGIPVFRLDGRLFESLSETENSQGALAAARKRLPPAAGFFRPGGNYLILDRLQDPGNIGVLIRTAEAAGFAGAMAIKGTADPYGPKAARVTAGALLRLPVLTSVESEDALRMLRDAGKDIVAADARAALNCYDADLRRDIALVVGNEGSGLSQDFREAARFLLRVPMPGGAESLNVSVAAALLMFETVRRNQPSGEGS